MPKLKLRRMMVWVIAVLVVGLAALKGLAVQSARMEPETGLTAEGKLRPCPASPNAVCSEDPDPARRVEPLRLRDGEGMAEVRALVESLPRWKVVSADGDYLHATARTAGMGFVDDVEFRIDREAGVVQVRSASRVGYSDFGANRKRVEALRRAWEGRVPRAGTGEVE